MVGDREMNINEPPLSDKIDTDELHPFDDSMALAIIQLKELTVVERIIMLPRSRSYTPKYICCSYTKSTQKHAFRLKIYLLHWENTKKIVRTSNKCFKMVINLSKIIV
jgi:hypothetical protein